MPRRTTTASQQTDAAWIKLSVASPEAQKMTGRPPPGYRKLYQAVLDGRLRARRVNGRVEIHRASLQELIAS